MTDTLDKMITDIQNAIANAREPVTIHNHAVPADRIYSIPADPWVSPGRPTIVANPIHETRFWAMQLARQTTYVPIDTTILGIP